jgi:hypothetical protein
MKKLSTVNVICICIWFLIGCENEAVTPVHTGLGEEISESQHSPATAKQNGNLDALRAPITGLIGGRSFTGNLSITEFIEQAGGMYAEVKLSDVKITGKDHKYLEWILEKETFFVPFTIDNIEESQRTVDAGRTAQVAATCSVLNLNLTGLNIDVLGLLVQTDPVNVVIAANDDEVLGNLICTVLDTLNNVVELVGLLNQILGLLSL